MQRKRDDALAMLMVIRDELEAGLEPFRPTWTLQHSRFYVAMRSSVELASAARPDAVSAQEADEELEAVLDEVRLDPERYGRLLDSALLAALARKAATEVGVDVSVWAAQGALDSERDHVDWPHARTPSRGWKHVASSKPIFRSSPVVWRCCVGRLRLTATRLPASSSSA